MNIGDILKSSWGYEQTNVDFYQVTRISNTFVWLREIESVVVKDDGANWMTGKVVAVKDKFTANSQEFKRKLRGNDEYVRIEPYALARPWSGQPEYFSTYG